ncbi:MAG TPA: glycosyltransferase family A protein [Candidatus Binataceae bacterium]|nr:glycosyltransferase family A protein [Candidatus Binataceae bacterium]
MPLFDVRALAQPVYQTEYKTPLPDDVAVIIPLFNYGHTILDTLRSVINQDHNQLSITLVDDCSTDDGLEKALAYLKASEARFRRVHVLRHERNQGLSMTRNSGIAWSAEPYLFMLDADNRIRPPALSRLLAALKISGAAFAYSQLTLFGSETGIGVADVWQPSKLLRGNYIDAMALIRRDALVSLGGYETLADDHGWEDYDLWCRFAKRGLSGVFVPELLCDYRVHHSSMLRTRTNRNAAALEAEMLLRHPDLA